MAAKELLRPGKVLVVGDVLEEVNRFNKADYVLWRIHSIDWSTNSMRLESLGSSTRYYGKGCIVWADIDSHSKHYRTKYLTYYHPNGKVLYGQSS